MQFKFTNTVLTAALLSGACASQALAHGDLGDLMVYSRYGKVFVGNYDFDGGSGLVTSPGPSFVFVTELENDWESTGKPGVDEPGIVTDGSAPADPDGQNLLFPANTALTIAANVLPGLGVNAAYWDGSGAVSFGATPHALEIEKGFSTITLDGTAATPVGSVSPWTSDGSGFAHDHAEYFIDEPDATATAGIYLFSLTFDTNNLDASDPIYFVAGYGLPEPQLDEAIEEAEEWVEANLAVPEPASLMLVSLGFAAVARRRHR